MFGCVFGRSKVPQLEVVEFLAFASRHSPLRRVSS